MNTIYMLKSTHLVGNSMSSEHEVTNYEKPFSSEEKAKSFAETEFGKKIDWRTYDGIIQSPDLIYVFYYIKKIEVDQ